MLRRLFLDFDRRRGGRSRRGSSLSQRVSISKNSFDNFFNREAFQDFTNFDVISGSTTNDRSNQFRNGLLGLKNALLGLRLSFGFLISLLFFLFLLLVIFLVLLFFLFLLFLLLALLLRGGIAVESTEESIEIDIDHLVTLVRGKLRKDLLSFSISFNTNEHLRSQFGLLDLEESVMGMETISFTLLADIEVRAVDTFVSHTDNRRGFATIADISIVDNIGRGLLKSGFAGAILVEFKQDLALDLFSEGGNLLLDLLLNDLLDLF